MRKVINCLKEDNPIIQKKLRRVTVEEGEKIATELFEILNKRKDGIGLAANQVGIDAAVAVLNVREPIVLINPKIISKGPLPVCWFINAPNIAAGAAVTISNKAVRKS